MVKLSLEEAQALVKNSGTKIHVRSRTVNEYYWRCSEKRCPKNKLADAITGTVWNWVVTLAAAHLKGHATRKAKLEKQKALESVLLAN